ncbi:MAG TPA: hypothetical protein VE733_30670 [Streptosporangiaceae bacterium]|jgi:hypothetical protein|nr:hypothetical protein [Streptosporangiaceae bacterium]
MTDADVSPVRRNRWLVLAGYSLLVASTQLLWLTFAAVTTLWGARSLPGL